MATIIIDKVTALTTAQVITAALLQREKTDRGQYLPVSMLDSALYYMWPDVMWSRTLLGEGVQHAGELADYFQVYKAKDGHVAIVFIRDEDFEALCVWRDSNLHKDDRFRTFRDKLANLAEFKAAVEALLADVTTDEICQQLDAFNVPVARANSLDDVHEDAQVRHGPSLVETSHPVAGPMRYPRPPFNFIGQDPFPNRHAPFPGDHAREILSELGVDDTEIDRLEQRDAADRKTVSSLRA
jgi:crotonobetainyl-CoA:carnitine CoA-transferase CaiB-like acyl-CoA transferase